jgi:VCBS repeat-containing protein
MHMPYGRRGGEFVVSKQNLEEQTAPSIAGFAAGGFIMVWTTSHTLQDGSGRAIKAQRYDAAGNAVGPEVLINSSAAGDQREPSVTTLASGGYVVTWETTDATQDGSGVAIKGQLFDSAGVKVGPEFLVNSQSASDQTASSVTGLEGGGFVVTWATADATQDGFGSAIKGQIYSPAGVAVGGEFLVNTGALGHESAPDVTSLSGGGFVATWTRGSGTNADIYAQVFDSTGAKTGSQFLVSTTSINNQDLASVTEISGGRFVVTWVHDVSLSTIESQIRARIFSADGTPIGDDFLVNTPFNDPVGNTPAAQPYRPSVEDLPDGGFVISWTNAGGSYDRTSVRGQFFDASGNPVGSEVMFSTATDRFEGGGEVAVDGNGMVFTVWESANQSAFNFDIRGQIYIRHNAPEIVSNGGGAAASVTVGENQTAAATILAVDSDGPGSLVYSIVGGADAARFAINASTGALTFVSAPNFEAPQDAGGNNVYDVVVSVTDNSLTDTQALAVTVSNVNEGVTIAPSETTYVYGENTSPVFNFSASDVEGDPLTWSIGGPDAARFTIDPTTGTLRFVTPFDFEAPVDVGADNFYNVTIVASDGSLSDSRALTIQIFNRNDGPVITSGGGGASASYSVAENINLVTTIAAIDPDAQKRAFTFSIAGGADAALFSISAQTGQLTFKSGVGANFEAPADAGGDNVYDVIVAVSDGFEPADTQALSITVTDANDAPVITSSATVSAPENQLAVTTVTATDLENSAITYAIVGGVDSVRFTINAQTGVLRFISAPNREAPLDSGANNVYNVTVSASDGQKSTTQALAVTVTDVNEAPVITSNGGGNTAAISVAENGSAVTVVAAADPEAQALSYSISGGADASRFLIDSATGALSFLTAPDREQPADSDGNNVYDVVVRASDGVLSDTQALSITVGNVNERPVIVSNGGGTSAFVEIDEGQTAVTTVVAVDPDGAGGVTYAITGGAHAGLFAINSATGALSFAAAPDYEAPLGESSNFYSVTVTASDGQLSTFQSVQVGVRNVNEGVTITSGAAPSVDENSTAVMTVTARDLDGDSVAFAISGGADAALFAIDSATGALRFLAAPNFEAPADSNGDNVYDVQVSASDGALSESRSLAVTVADRAEAPVIVSGGGGDSASLSIAENLGLITTILADDPDAVDSPRSFSIVGGADAALFSIHAEAGQLYLAVAGRNFEAPADSDGDHVYEVIVAVSDGVGPADTQTLSITVTDSNEAPVITSNGGDSSVALTFEEGTSQVATVVAGDPDGSAPVYSITGGNDAALFTIDSATGVVSFIEAPDYETRLDAHDSSIYEVIVTASDGELSDSQFLSVWITNVNEAVTITSGGGADSVAVTVGEDQSLVANVDAVDADGTPVFYSIAGGADAAFFGIHPLTGELYIAGADYDLPADADGDNVYEVIVAADDGWLSDTQAFSVTVADVDEPLFFTSYASDFYVNFELGENGLGAAVVAAEDPDGGAIAYSIVDSYDGASFTIDAQTGEIQFLTAPNYESPGDLDGNNVYTILVAATDGTFFDYQNITIWIGDIEERPVITTGPALSVDENNVYVKVNAADSDGDALTYSIVGGADSAHFVINPETGDLTAVTALDYEAPVDADGDNVYEVTVRASDGQLSDERQMSITVNDVFDDVEIVSYGGADTVSLTVEEGLGYQIIDVDASFSAFWGTRFAITGGADAALFEIDPISGLISFAYPFLPDFEAPADAGGNNVYDLVVTATTATSSDSQTFAITVADRNEQLSITSHGWGDTIVLNEGNQVVTTIVAVDKDGDAPVYSISGGADAALFAIDSATGVLTFIAAPDFEAPGSAAGTNLYSVEVAAGDGEFTHQLPIRVQIGNVNETPVITSGGGGGAAAVTVNENGVAVTSITASDVDGNPLIWSITGGADASLFTIESGSGVLRFLQGPNYEAPGDAGGNNVYDVVVSVTDGVLTDSQALAVTVSNVNEAVAITSNGGGAAAAVAVAENGNAVTVVAASDPDGGAVTYAIAGGADSARFTINASTGALSFVSAPNFEAPADAGGNNVYDVVVSATDGSWTDTQALAVSVGNVNEGVVITSSGGGSSASVAVAENGTAVTTVSASDADGGAVTYAIAGGADSSRFTINAATGALAFIAAPNFEAPGDVGGNNVYDVLVSASDGLFSDTQAIAVQVGNVNEAPAVTSNGGGATADVSVAENSLAVTNVSAGDPDGTAATYAIVGGADAARFTINPQTGLLQFVAAPDYELPADSNGDNVYAVVVRASDGLLSDDQALSVTVANVRDGNTVTGTSAGDSISATSTNVALRTSNEEDTVFGRDGHDNIQGMAGDDDLYGEAGNDVLIGGAGADRLTGGLGKDTYTYNSVSESSVMARDSILDFSRAQGDKISLSAIDSNSLVGNNQAFTFIGTAAFSNVAGQLRYETWGGVTTISGDVDGDAVADLVIQLSGSIALISSDFIL